MKTTSFLFLFGFTCFFLQAQNVASTAYLTSGGYQAGSASATPTYNTFYGATAGKLTTGISNTLIGNFYSSSTQGLSTGASNTLVGHNAGGLITTGSRNTSFGHNAGGYLNNSDNTCIGYQTMGYNTSFTKSVALGNEAGCYTVGTDNLYLGYRAGYFTKGSNNILIGAGAGTSQTISNKLFIDNSATTTPLIWGDFAMDQLKLNGKVGIGFENLTVFPTTAGAVDVSNYKLFVAGGILADEMRIKLRGPLNSLWADYVFLKEYKLKTIFEVEKYIKQNGHLENVPSAEDVKKNGLNLSEIARIQQEKIEELTLYMIEQAKKIKILEDILINK